MAPRRNGCFSTFVHETATQCTHHVRTTPSQLEAMLCRQGQIPFCTSVLSAVWLFGWLACCLSASQCVGLASICLAGHTMNFSVCTPEYLPLCAWDPPIVHLCVPTFLQCHAFTSAQAYWGTYAHNHNRSSPTLAQALAAHKVSMLIACVVSAHRVAMGR